MIPIVMFITIRIMAEKCYVSSNFAVVSYMG